MTKLRRASVLAAAVLAVALLATPAASPAPTAPLLTGYPQGTIGDDQAAFSFHLAGADSYECRTFVAGTPEGSKPAFAACSGASAGYHFATGLADGSYTFEARAVDAGEPGDVASHDFAVTSDPVVQWIYEPSGTYDSRFVTATFTAAGATSFQCSLDGAAFTSCGSGAQGHWISAELADGSHTLGVRANDGGGFGPVATAVFVVQAAPEVIWVSKPQGTYTTRYLTATFQADRTTVFQCSLDGVTFSPCGSGAQGYWTSAELANGSYTLHVRAQDAKGPGSVALAPFTVDKPLAIEWIARPSGTINGTSVAATFRSDGATRFDCSLDGATFSPCGLGEQGYWTAASNVTAGAHTLSVRASDARNTGSEASTTFTTGSASGTPLDVTVTAGPAAGATIPSAWVAFSWAAAGAQSYRFAWDDALFGGYSVFNRQATTNSLADGPHKLRVQAQSAGGTEGPVLEHAFTVDTQAQTTVARVSGPGDGGTIPSAWVAFSWAAAGAQSYRFAWDDALFGGYSVFNRQATTNSLADGPHKLRVQAQSAGGTEGPVLEHAFTVDTQAQTTVARVSGPGDGGTIPSAWVAFSWAAAGAQSYRFAWDDALFGGYSVFNRQATTTGLADGLHKLRVQAQSAGGTEGPILEHTFTVQAGPWVSFWSKPRTVLPVGTAAFSFSAPAAQSYRFAWDDALFGGYSVFNRQATTTGLADGPHKLRVQAQSSGGAEGPVAVETFFVETRAPQTTIDSAPPPYSNSATATFAFHADEPATFECVIDGGAGQPCSSPWVRPGLTEGQHDVAIRAIDLAGKVDSTPATHSWVVDTIAPTVIDLTGPTGVVSETDATFAYGSDEAPVTFECQLDGGGWVACGASQAYTDLPDGDHLFEVRAKDQANNVGEAKSREWTVVTDPPETNITSAPTGFVNVNTASIEFGSPDSPVTFECSLDGGAFAACTSPRPLSGLADGAHTFAVRAVKGGVLADPTPATASWTVDTQPPVVTITSGPSGTVGSGSYSFTFTANEPVTFECKLGAGDWAACTSPHGVGALPGGTYVFQVRATDAAGNVGPPAERTWTVDDVAPVVVITSGPDALTTATDATFTFTVDDAAATAECRLDSGAWLACTSPAGYTGLGDGAHALRVRATDAAGNVSVVELWSWTIDTVAPVVTITDGPSGSVSSTSASLSFTVSEAGSSAECRLDGGPWQPCSSPAAYTGLSDGSHTVEIRATDAAGNVGGAASRTWDVDTVAPIATITSGPSGTVADADAELAFAIDDASATAECRLDAGGWQSCTSPAAYPGLGSGSHTFQVRATDPAGNVGPVAERTWTIDPVEPETTIDSGPALLTNVATATLEFSSDTPSATFECNLDNEGWQACVTPLLLSGLADGPHEIRVRATSGGLTDPTPATRSWTVDTVAPVLTVTSKPSGTTTSAAGSRFEFTVDDASATVECSIDGGAWTACASPFSPTLADGQHTVDIRAVDPAGNASPVDSTAWTVDGTLPQVQITSGPAGTTTSRDGQFTFTVDDPTATVECRFDLGAWVACTSPAPFTGFADGPHSFDVRATDPAGNQSAEGWTWFIDATAPVVTVVSGPAGTTILDTATIVFTVDDPQATLACALDGAPYMPCTSPVALADLADGGHTFTITATDPRGNVGEPAAVVWTVDRTPPVVTITSGPSGVVNTDDVTFTFEADDPSDFRCRLDGGVWVACTSPVDYTDLAVGDHLFEVEATNGAGLISEIVQRSFTIEILGEPDLALDVAAVDAGGAPIAGTGLGDDFAFRVTATNNGPVAAEDTVVTVPLSSDITILAGGLPAGCTSPDADGPVSCDLGTVGAGLSKTFAVGVEATFACTVWGDSLDSTDANPILGTTGDDVICGGGGSDVIRGRGGNDLVWGYGNRFENPAAGPDSVSTGASATYGPGDLSASTPGPAVVTIRGNDGADTITTGSGTDTIYGEEGGDAIVSGGGGDTVHAGDGDDTVDTGSGADAVKGGAGNDLVRSGNDGDVVDGGAGNDTLEGGNGGDTIDGGGDADAVTGAADNDVLRGGDGSDSVNGGGGDDVVFGDAGDDPQLLGGDGTDEIHGGEGSDTADGGAGDDSIFGEGGNDTLAGGSGTWTDRLWGGDGADSANGGGGDDFVFGDAGDDVQLLGGDGVDEIRGGEGNDSVDGGAGGDTIFGEGGNDTLAGGSGTWTDTIWGGDGADTADGGAGNDSIAGEAGDDALYGGAGGDTISGGDGNDTARGANTTGQGSDGTDRIEGGNGNDVLFGDGGSEQTVLGTGGAADFVGGVFGGAGNDDMFGGAGDDEIHGGDGNDSADGGAGNDTILGEGDGDTRLGGLMGGTGNDTIAGGAGGDEIHGGDANDTVRGDADGDTIFGDAGSDAVNGGDDADVIFGGAGADDLWGGQSSDTVDGGDGKDFVIGENGGDTLVGGSGQDIVIGDDTLGDFTGHGDDVIHGGIRPSNVDGSKNWLYGNGGDDTIYGGTSKDFMFGSVGDDEMYGNDGADVMLGDDGDDQVSGGNGADELHGGTASLVQLLNCGSGNDKWSFGPLVEVRVDCEASGAGTPFLPGNVDEWPRQPAPKP